MVYDKLCNAGKYTGLNPYLEEALQYINSGHDFNSDKKDEWYYVDGKNFYYKVTDIVTFDSEPEEYRYEYHKHCLDLHYLLSGTEGVAFGDLSQMVPCEPFNEDGDFGFAKGDLIGRVTMRPGDIMMFFPNDAHRVWLGDGHILRKVLIKLALD